MNGKDRIKYKVIASEYSFNERILKQHSHVCPFCGLWECCIFSHCEKLILLQLLLHTAFIAL